MREDCNKRKQEKEGTSMHFNSCMCEDCNVIELPGGSWIAYFDSYMREDCDRDEE